MIMISDVVMSIDLEKLFKVTHIQNDIAYGFNAADNSNFVNERIDRLVPVNANQKAIKYLLNTASNKFEIGALILRGYDSKKMKAMEQLTGYTKRQLMRFKQALMV